MKKLMLALLLGGFALPALAGPAGHWKGEIALPGGAALPIEVSLEPGQGEQWRGQISIPAQGLRDFALSQVRVDGLAVHFEMAGVPGLPTFDGQVEDDRLSGTFSQGGQTMPFELRRSERVAAQPKAPTRGVPGTGLTGNWFGVLDVGPMKLRLAVDITGGPDGKPIAVMRSLDQGSTIPVAQAHLDSGEVTLTLPSIDGAFAGTLSDDGSEIIGQWTQRGRSLPLKLLRLTEPFALARPQDPKPPFPYDEREVRFASAGVELAGTVVTPHGEGPFPAVVFVSGSGAQDRDESLMGHRPFRVIADHLARRGIASLRYDDRGAGQSGGEHLATTVDGFAADALAAVETLLAQPKIKTVGILGHSEGGLTGPMAARQDDRIAFLVLLAPPGVPLRELLVTQTRDMTRLSGASDALLERISTEQREDLGAVADAEISTEALREWLESRMKARLESYSEAELAILGATPEATQQSIEIATTPWFRSLMRAEPGAILSGLRVPVLALFGERDIQVAAEANATALRAALADNPDATVQILPGLNHLLQPATTGSVAEYAQIETTVDPSVLERISEWIASRFGTPQP